MVAGAHAMLRAVYHVIDGRACQDLSTDYFDRRHGEKVTQNAVGTLERLCYRVSLESAA